MIITVDPRSHVPPYEQVREQIRGLIGSGALPAGHRLPPVRRLAADLGLAANTVARAYRELEQEGLLDGRGTRGTFVAATAPADPLSAAADDLVRRARTAGLNRDDLVGLLLARWDDERPRPG
ncbi:GntR family transcriptional regulator [Nocardiopsis suaedae]|uniref:GntR family transcriptional regulator n=1 Tax=Nocardiopsis suaedae TaxID=3018444 RepID=UPI0038CD546E